MQFRFAVNRGSPFHRRNNFGWQIARRASYDESQVSGLEAV